MTSQYLENHKKELEAIAEHCEKVHNNPAYRYRAKCIRDLIKSENLKRE